MADENDYYVSTNLDIVDDNYPASVIDGETDDLANPNDLAEATPHARIVTPPLPWGSDADDDSTLYTCRRNPYDGLTVLEKPLEVDRSASNQALQRQINELQCRLETVEKLLASSQATNSSVNT